MEKSATVMRVKSIATILINAIEDNAENIQNNLPNEDVLNILRTELILKDLKELKEELELI